HRIIAVDIDQGPLGYQRAEYRYDILGRRIEKRLWKASAIANTVTYHQHEPDEVYTFGWVGMRLVSEHSSAAPHTTVYHAYNDQSYTPLARIECTDNPLNPQRAIYYTHSSLSGLPEALTNSDGEIVWQGQYSAWGHLQRQTRPTSTFNREQNLRFQGQYFDKETGLHYNTFRYYAPDLGRFTQQDPIGLAGGINLYAYAPNPLTWVDPWGWAKEKTYEVVKYMSKNEVDAVRKANGGIVPHFNSNRVARWLNMPGADWNPKGEKFRIVFTINQKGMDMLNNHVDMDKLLLGETDLPRGVLSKPNEIGARGIGVGLLDEFNKQIKSARIETEIKTGKWKNIGVIKKC
ncbi:RHS repeat-associated core domain-containing protein, partial [Proteus mirabilis]